MKRINQIISAIENIKCDERNYLALHEPCNTEKAIEYVNDCLTSGWVSSVGAYVDLLEKKLQEFTQINHAIAVVNGTSALHVALLALNVCRDDEIILPSLTFVATANAISYCGAVPHFVDCKRNALVIDVDKLDQYLKETTFLDGSVCINKSTGKPIKALIAVHVLGHAADLLGLREICDRYNLHLIEDAAEALGTFYRGKHVGGIGDVAILSFNGNKIITTGGGGAVLTNDSDISEKVRHLTTTGRSKDTLQVSHDTIAYNYRLANINAALGCSQMEYLPEFVEQKRTLAERYRNIFSGIENITYVSEPAHSRSNYWLNAIIVEDGNSEFCQELLHAAEIRNIQLRLLWKPLHKLGMYIDCPKMDLSTTEDLEFKVVTLPSSSYLGR